jgi:hypothetical protein
MRSPLASSLAVAALSCGLVSACRITDQEVRDEIAKRGGTIITKRNQERLGGEMPFVVENPENSLYPPPQIGIRPAPPAGAAPPCKVCCWETVSREYLDGMLVVDPGKLELHDKRLAQTLSQRSVNGYFVDAVSNATGQGPDGACDINKKNLPEYTDAPNFVDDDFGNNPINSGARIYVLEQETCLRCLDPVTGYLGCVKWYYVKVRGNEVSGPLTKLVTTGVVTAAPSPEFRAAVDAFNRP